MHGSINNIYIYKSKISVSLTFTINYLSPFQKKVFGMWFDVGHGYHVDKTTGIAKGNDPESIYAVMSGRRYNGKCCFDYGNSENTDKQPVHTGDYACGAMEAIYFGNVRQNATPPRHSVLY